MSNRYGCTGRELVCFCYDSILFYSFCRIHNLESYDMVLLVLVPCFQTFAGWPLWTVCFHKYRLYFMYMIQMYTCRSYFIVSFIQNIRKKEIGNRYPLETLSIFCIFRLLLSSQGSFVLNNSYHRNLLSMPQLKIGNHFVRLIKGNRKSVNM